MFGMTISETIVLAVVMLFMTAASFFEYRETNRR